MSNVISLSPNAYRSIFISDVHLGTKDCNAEYLSDFLKTIQCERLYLVGDIVDLWNMRNSVYWPQSHNEVIRTILKLSKNGTKVFLVPGNHDELLRDFVDHSFGNIEIHKRIVHKTPDNRKFLVLHGDEFDRVVACNKLMSLIGDFAYDGLLFSNRIINIIRKKNGLNYWSLANYIKSKVKNAISYIEKFEDAVTRAAKHDRMDGVICGHIHHAEIKQLNDVVYCNTGDWVESCTAIAESFSGELKLVHWTEQKSYLKSDKAFKETRLKKTA